MRSEGYGSRRVCLSVCVCVCVCVSVKSHLTFGASVRPENAVTYSVGNKGVAFSLTPRRSRVTALAALYGRRTSRRLSKPNMGNSVV